jgi:hypothetical protein
MTEGWKGVVIRTGSNSAEHAWWKVEGKTLRVHEWRENLYTGSNVGAPLTDPIELAEGDDPVALAKAVLRASLPVRGSGFSDPWIHKWRNPGIV